MRRKSVFLIWINIQNNEIKRDHVTQSIYDKIQTPIKLKIDIIMKRRVFLILLLIGVIIKEISLITI